MQNLEWTTVDKSAWGDGPWQSEPDKIQWTDEETKLPCLAVRHPSSGHWCGYVGIDESHPYFKVGYSECTQEDCEESLCDHPSPSGFEVHGGLTFSDFCAESKDPSQKVCHLVEPGENDQVWWFGFDCAHCYDTAPPREIQNKKYGLSASRSEVYRTLEYVRNQCQSLAKQLKEVA